MAENSSIQWTDHTFNPWIGCTKVSPGCAHCYAEELDRKRFSKTMDGGTKDKPVSHWGKGAPRHLTSTWSEPVRWDLNARNCDACCNFNMPVRPFGEFGPLTQCRQCGGPTRNSRVFCASLADWLDDEVPIEWLADLMSLVLRKTPNLNWLLLTKRPQNWRDRLIKCIQNTHCDPLDINDLIATWLDGNAPRNVWLGTTVEDQKRADERIPALLNIPANIRFLSVEPMLELISLDQFFWRLPEPICEDCPKDVDCVCGYQTAKENDLPSIDWVIFGGESGPGARPCHIEWIRDGVKQCRAAGVAPFVKQLGSVPVQDNDLQFAIGDTPVQGFSGIELKDPKGGDWSEWPEDLRIREFP